MTKKTITHTYNTLSSSCEKNSDLLFTSINIQKIALKRYHYAEIFHLMEFCILYFGSHEQIRKHCFNFVNSISIFETSV